MLGGHHAAASLAPLADSVAPPDVGYAADGAGTAAAERAALRPLQRAEAQEQAERAEAEASLDVERQRMAAAQEAAAAKEAAEHEGKTTDEIGAALKGEGDSVLSEIASPIKGDEYWMYSRFFGIGLIKMMDMAGVEQDMSVAYDVMETWMAGSLGKAHYTACVSSWF